MSSTGSTILTEENKGGKEIITKKFVSLIDNISQNSIK